jgi:hypothetical protein
VLRLTLRTLLAYLDDTLEPGEIKRIGQKVAESDAAQELIARIKQVTRRRRLTTPPATGPGAFDPNTVAEYLDNELSPEQMAELEKVCLDSDVHLAEVAASHQILTLVLGEPALVPPTARERMYGLVHGREAIPFRKARRLAGGDEEDEEPIARTNWALWAAPLVGVFLVLALGLALWQALSDRNDHSDRVAGVPPVVVADRDKDKGKVGGNDKDKGGPGPKDNGKPAGGSPDAGKPGGGKPGVPPDGGTPPDSGKPTGGTPDGGKPEGGNPEGGKAGGEVKPVAIEKPSSARVAVGTFVGGPERGLSLLAQRPRKPGAEWSRLKNGDRVYTTDELVSLPGYASEVQTDNGVGLLLRGNVPEFALPPPDGVLMHLLLDSALDLHKPAQGIDADLTFRRGRLYLSNRKQAGPVVVRLRFEDEVWDLTLSEPGTEVGLDLFRQYTSDVNYRDGEAPQARLYLSVLQGKADVRLTPFSTRTLTAPPGPALLPWNNVRWGAGEQQPIRVERKLPVWEKTPPVNDLSRRIALGLESLSMRAVGKKPLTVALEEGLAKDTKPEDRLLAIYSFGALDDARQLLEILGDNDPAHQADREASIYVLRRWISQDAGNGRRLYDEKGPSGLLVESKKYTSIGDNPTWMDGKKPTGEPPTAVEDRNRHVVINEAEKIYVLLHSFPPETAQRPSTLEHLAVLLAYEKVAIAELAWWHLQRLVPGVKLPAFNAADSLTVRKRVAAEVIRKLMDEGKLPVAPLGSTASPGGR